MLWSLTLVSFSFIKLPHERCLHIYSQTATTSSMMEMMVAFVHHVISSKLSTVPDMKKLKCICRMKEAVKHYKNTMSSSLKLVFGASSHKLYFLCFWCCLEGHRY